MPLILGLETSCDETAAAVVADGVWVLSNVIATQHELHERYRGVVPEIASRAHLEKLRPVIETALQQAGVGLHELDGIAVGNRPGLIGSLLVGVSAAKALAWSLGKPLLGVNHVHAHLYAGLMHMDRQALTVPPVLSELFPALGLVVSGGHTSLYHMQSPTQLTRIGHTIDDAAGEAYDKAAVILQLGYPGGPRLDQLAHQTGANPTRFQLPRSLLAADSLDFSFSGLKTALLYAVRGHPIGRGTSATFTRSADQLSDDDRRDLASAFQHAVVDTLMLKIERACMRWHESGQPPRSLFIGGGVSANRLLRARASMLESKLALRLFIPPMSLCLDNAAMIAGLAHQQWQQGHVDDLHLPAIASVEA